MKRQAKRKNIPRLRFVKAVYDKENPARGCLLSHLNVIKDARRRGLNNILILEDDCLFKKSFKLPSFPEKYDMLYLGGNVAEILKDGEGGKLWNRVSTWTTHSYLINSTIFDIVISGLNSYTQEIDRFYKDVIHQKYMCYMLDPELTTQKEGYSDIEMRDMDYSKMNTIDDVGDIKFAEHEIREDKSYVLKLDDIPDNELPNVSILTPTRNRRIFFELAINNYKSFIYPREKLEWIIVDDGEDNLNDLFKNQGFSDRVKYFYLDVNKSLPISMKRNLCVKYAKYDFLVHMDDDDYYPPTSILSRIKVLLQNINTHCVGVNKIGCYDIINCNSFTVNSTSSILSEASLAYTRTFYEECCFDERVSTGEGKLFLRGRQYLVLQVPYPFVIISLTHGGNITSSRKLSEGNTGDLFKLDEKVMGIIENIRSKL